MEIAIKKRVKMRSNEQKQRDRGGVQKEKRRK
jgi:hypothetical protein